MYINENKTIYHSIVAMDFILAWCITLCYIRYGSIITPRPLTLLVVTTIAMLVAQLGFSTIVHYHHSTIDRIMWRTTLLSLTHFLVSGTLCTLHKWIADPVCSLRALAEIEVILTVCLQFSRVAERSLLRVFRKYGHNSRSTCFIGNIDCIENILEQMDDVLLIGIKMTGYYSPSSSEKLHMPYLGDYTHLEKTLNNEERIADEIYCALPSTEGTLIKRIMSVCNHQTMHFYYVPTFLYNFGSYLKPHIIGDQAVFANFSEPLNILGNRILKRTFDIVTSAIAIVCLLPLLPLVAIAIKIQSPGPIFFRQVRTGRNGKDFYIYKFRSMHINTDADSLQATKEDPRKFAFGNFMRKTSIDELPQLWNILKGDMSVVGPRPHMNAHTEQYRTLIDNYMQRHYVRPGLTGWAQTTGFRGETSELWQMEGRIKRDIWYIQNWTFWLDIRIIFRTALQVIMKDKQAY